MKTIIATEQIYNSAGYIIAIKYYYEDGTFSEKKVFIPPKKK